jgi:DNA-binding IclR family transcriptional regulator
MLACMKPDRAASILAANRPRLGEWHLDEGAALEAVAKARSLGFLCAESRVNPERRVLSYALRGVTGQPIAALSVIGAPGRLTCERVARLLPALAEAAREIGQGLLRHAQGALSAI